MARLKDQVRTLLAWQSIVTDYRDTKIVLDNLMARHAEAALTQTQAAVQPMIRETYKWVLAPMQEARPGKGVSDLQWESFALTPNAPDLTQEIVRVLQENELSITAWAPIHLANMLEAWFWKPDMPEVSALNVWQKTCQYLYLPRLHDDTVFRAALTVGTGSRDFFGTAYENTTRTMSASALEKPSRSCSMGAFSSLTRTQPRPTPRRSGRRLKRTSPRLLNQPSHRSLGVTPLVSASLALPPIARRAVPHRRPPNAISMAPSTLIPLWRKCSSPTLWMQWCYSLPPRLGCR